ncbi:threonine dehydratase catabolic [Bisporella sp. PMI_857]|nr:threonine dehydratase catabolic [Bisporella sp. PMI_857]
MADPRTSPPLSREGVLAAQSIIKEFQRKGDIHFTPILSSKFLNELASTPQTPEKFKGGPWEGNEPARPKLRLWFKAENLQKVGAFKVRGAFHATSRLMKEEGWVKSGGREKGVVTHSSGNHAQALALAAQTMGIPAHIVMPSISTPLKIAGTKGYGATIHFSGSTAAEREAVVADVIESTGATLIPPYDHPDIILGQGTLGIEIQEQVEELKAKAGKSGGLNAIITPCGGGGMLSGTALSCEGTGILVFGAEPEFEGADDCKRGLEVGKRIESVKTLTIADGLRTHVGTYPWTVIHDRRLVRQMFSVTEEQIKAALRLVFERMKLVVEPSAVVGLATVLFNEDFRKLVEEEADEDGWDLGVVFSGGNTSIEALGKLFST